MRQPALKPTIARLQAAGKIAHRPEIGWYKLKLIRRGPWVPAIIWCPCPMAGPDDSPDPADWGHATDPWRGPRWLRARIGDAEADPLLVWERGYRIGRAEYEWRLQLSRWAKRHAPEQPEARARETVDLTQQPSLF